jgi:hypothetical protein
MPNGEVMRAATGNEKPWPARGVVERLLLGRTLPRCCGLRDPRGNAPLHRCPFLDQLGIPGLVLGDVGRGSFLGCLPLAYELRDGGLLCRSSGLQRPLDPEVRCRLAASCGNLRFKVGLPYAGSV